MTTLTLMDAAEHPVLGAAPDETAVAIVAVVLGLLVALVLGVVVVRLARARKER